MGSRLRLFGSGGKYGCRLPAQRDSKFTTAFDGVFAGNGTRVIKASVRSPRANSFAERFVGTLRREYRYHVLIFGEQHLGKVLAEYPRHYNERHPHPGCSRSLR